MRKKLALLFVLMLFCVHSAAAGEGRTFNGSFTPNTNGGKLLSLIVSFTKPEAVELRLDQEPDADGSVRNLHCLVTGAFIGGCRVEKLAIEAAFVEFNPPSGWDPSAENPLVVRKTLRTNFEAIVLEKDINRALMEYTGKDWTGISVDLKPGKINARGRYHVKSPSLTILAEVRSGLDLREGKEIWLKDVFLKINHEDQTPVIREELQKIQPIASLRDFPFPVILGVISIDDRQMRIATRTAPRPFEGIVYRYVRDS